LQRVLRHRVWRTAFEYRRTGASVGNASGAARGPDRERALSPILETQFSKLDAGDALQFLSLDAMPADLSNVGAVVPI